MERRSEEIEDEQKRAQREAGLPGETCRRANGRGLASLLWHFLLLNPRLTPRHERRKNVRFIFVEFSAWQFAGSDMVWAGLITTLCDRVKDDFGKVPLSVVRALGGRVERDLQSEREWVYKTLLCCPIWILLPALMVLSVVLLALCVAGAFLMSDNSEDLFVSAQSAGGLMLLVPFFVLVKNVLLVGKNMLYSQKDVVKSLMNKTDYSSQLGFMNEVKREVEVLTNFVRYMEIFERRKIRIVLKIVNLDRCTPDKVVGVLDAINILLSDREAPFISILAVDPAIIVSCVEQSAKLKGVADNGYVYLNRIIALPFSIPDMDGETKSLILNDVIDRKMSRRPSCPGAWPEDRAEGKEADLPESSEEGVPLVRVTVETSHGNVTLRHNTEIEEQMEAAYDCLKSKDLERFIEGNYLEMRRIVNTLCIMIRLMVVSVEPGRETIWGKIVPWVVLTTHWPTRFSWIWQCLEDQRQVANGAVDGKQKLLEIYGGSYDELKLLHESMAALLELDGDPELFQELLEHYGFTVTEAEVLLPYTVNVPYSLKREMELLRGKDSFARRVAVDQDAKPFTVLQVLKMDVDQVVEQVKEELKLDPKYAETIKKQKLNGRTLIYSHNSEIRATLGMDSLSDWATFKLYFLQARQQTLDATCSQWRQPQGLVPTRESGQREQASDEASAGEEASDKPPERAAESTA